MMPATHAQIGRVGGKHGLMPGSWVFGIFLDGEDAQHPMVLGTISLTAKTTEENDTPIVYEKDGRIPGAIRGFKKVNTNRDFPTAGLISENETEGNFDASSGDTSGHTTLDDSKNGDCPIDRSLSTELRFSEKSKGRW